MNEKWKKHPLWNFDLRFTNPEFIEWAFGDKDGASNYAEEIDLWNKFHGSNILLSVEGNPIDNLERMLKLYHFERNVK